jgi:hypothetical protein
MDPKQRPNHERYIEVLRRMTPEARLLKAFELSDFTKQVFREGLRRTFPEATDKQIHQLMLDRLSKCHNRNY